MERNAFAYQTTVLVMYLLLRINKTLPSTVNQSYCTKLLLFFHFCRKGTINWDILMALLNITTNLQNAELDYQCLYCEGNIAKYPASNVNSPFFCRQPVGAIPARAELESSTRSESSSISATETLAAILSATTSLRIGRVAGNSKFRYPCCNPWKKSFFTSIFVQISIFLDSSKLSLNIGMGG